MAAVASLITAQTAAGQQFIGPRRLATYILQAFGENDLDAALAELIFKPEQPAIPSPSPAPAPAVSVQQPVTASDSDLTAVLETLRDAARGIQTRLWESSQPQAAPQFAITVPPAQVTVTPPAPQVAQEASQPVFNLQADIHMPPQPPTQPREPDVFNLQADIHLPPDNKPVAEAAAAPAPTQIIVNPTPVTIVNNNQMPEQPAPSVFVSVPPAEPPTDLTSRVERDSEGRILRVKTSPD
jgi:hypothetical protein